MIIIFLFLSLFVYEIFSRRIVRCLPYKFFIRSLQVISSVRNVRVYVCAIHVLYFLTRFVILYGPAFYSTLHLYLSISFSHIELQIGNSHERGKERALVCGECVRCPIVMQNSNAVSRTRTWPSMFIDATPFFFPFP